MAEYDLGVATLGTEVDLSGLDEGLEQAEEESSSRFSAMGDALKVGLIGATAAVTAAVVGIGVAAVDVASQVQQSQNDIQASLGVSADVAKGMADDALRIWGGNTGDSIEEVTAAIVEANQQFADMGGIAGTAQDRVVNSAFAMRDVFGKDVNETIAATHTLMDKFGLSAEDATDFLVKGFQNGLNSSDDFLDTIGEYSNLFADGGASADEFFSLLDSGLQSGVLGTDKAADAFKEFGIRIVDGSSTTADALKGLGLSADEINRKITSGELTKADAFQMVMEKLKGVKDVSTQTQLGVALIGTQFEDLGNAGALALDMTADKLANVSGGVDTLSAKYNNWPAMWEGIKRSALVAIEPIGESLLSLANMALPYVQQGMAAVLDVINSIMNAGKLLFSGDFQGGIFGLQEDDPIIDTLFTIRDTIMNLWTDVQPSLQQLAAWFAETLPIAFAELKSFYESTLAPIFSALADVLVNSIFPALMELASWIGEQLPGVIAVLADAWTNILRPAFEFIANLVATVVIPAIGELVNWLRENLPTAAQFVADTWNNVLKPAFLAVWSFLTESAIPTITKLATETFTVLNNAVQSVANFWNNTLKPALMAVWDVISRYVIPLLTALANVAIALVKKEVELLAALWNNVLKPALDAVWKFIQTNLTPVLQFLADRVMAGVKSQTQSLADLWEDVLKPAIDALSSILSTALKPAFEGLNSVLSSVKGWFTDIGTSVSNLIDWINDLIEKINSVDVPDWLEGHSPPPMAEWFGYIADEAERTADALPDFADARIGAPMTGYASSVGALAGATSSGANVSVTLVYQDSGESWLRRFVQAEITKSQDETGYKALGRIRSGA